MEADPQTDAQQLSYQHASGEVFEAANLEAAQGLCPVLGKMSLEEAGLLLELENIGKQQLSSQKTPETTMQAMPKPGRQRIEKYVETTVTTEDLSERHVTDLDPAAVALLPLATKTAYRAREDSLAAALEHERASAAEAALSSGVTATAATAETVPGTRQERPAGAQREQAAKVIKPSLVEKPEPVLEKITGRQTGPLPAFIEDANIQPPNTFEATLDPSLEEQQAIAGQEATYEAIYPASEEVVVAQEPEYPVMPAPEPGDYQLAADPVFETMALPTTETANFLVAELAVPTAMELPAPAAEMEQALMQLTEALEQPEPKAIQKVHEILEKIIALPFAEDTPAQKPEEIEQQLEELFVELFEAANISYTPELVQSFAQLTRQHYLEKLLQVTHEALPAEEALPDEIGTREFLQKLQGALRAIKQAAIQFYELGRSVLRLYSLAVPSFQYVLKVPANP